jgi:hypothetical protein
MSYASARTRSQNARQTTPSDSVLPYAYDVARARHIHTADIGPSNGNLHTTKPTVRGYSANYTLGARHSPVGASPLGSYVRNNTYGIKALPIPLHADDTFYELKKSYVAEPASTLLEKKTVDLVNQTEKEGGVIVAPTDAAAVTNEKGEAVEIVKTA